MRRAAMALLALVTATAAMVATTQPANAQVTHTCRPDYWTNKCASGYAPANRTLNRVWIGIDSTSIVDWEVWDRETGARVGSGRVSPDKQFRHGIYGLYGSKYQLVMKGSWGNYGFICDC
ncbi:hypothetical protein [Nonomuraea cavernae]|uniref:Uncharacterized protein n=1 Tax=Nonomuraea cavernae TaxID=2045107 RepID=A0A917YW92_9ACTN|nr:hypothetical protein [Nonomuraea cavernae]MCA2187382.1 hypothetical protein [Nonomuraea cavernae]GGO68451.1 hypothetical protein GCM10012289_27250 [Nonomuraea cavernae]